MHLTGLLLIMGSVVQMLLQYASVFLPAALKANLNTRFCFVSLLHCREPVIKGLCWYLMPF